MRMLFSLKKYGRCKLINYNNYKLYAEEDVARFDWQSWCILVNSYENITVGPYGDLMNFIFFSGIFRWEAEGNRCRPGTE